MSTPLFVPLLLRAQQARPFIQLLTPPKAPTMTQPWRLHRILPLSSRRMCLFCLLSYFWKTENKPGGAWVTRRIQVRWRLSYTSLVGKPPAFTAVHLKNKLWQYRDGKSIKHEWNSRIKKICLQWKRICVLTLKQERGWENLVVIPE